MKKDSTKKMVAIPIVIAIATIIIFANYYFVKPIKKMNEKKEVSVAEKFELEHLTIAYLNQNNNKPISSFLFHNADDHKYEVAAEYYYLKNGKEHLDEYDKILELSRLIFDDKKIEVTNFVINIDQEKCGKEKYSTIEGFINNSSCDLDGLFYEIVAIYKQNFEYVVEFYASTAIQEEVEATEICESFETPLSYNLKLIDLEGEEFYKKSESKCCSSNCALEGVNSFKKDIITHAKSNNKLYKMIFDKKGDYFVFSELKKV